MSTFKIPPRSHDFTCRHCGQTDRGPEGSTICSECQYYQDHPDQAPEYFTWTGTSEGWAAQANWRERTPHPEPGDLITVHRRDGSTSEHTVVSLRNTHYDRTANLVITLDVL